MIGKKLQGILVLLSLAIVPELIIQVRDRTDADQPVLVVKKTDRPPLTNFFVRDELGLAHNLDQYRGKVILVNFWATWCAPCIKEMPSLDHLNQLLRGREFEVLTISEDQAGLPVVLAFFKRMGLKTLPIFIDPEGEVSEKLGIDAFPTSIVVDRNGRQMVRFVGGAKWDGPQAIAAIKHIISLP